MDIEIVKDILNAVGNVEEAKRIIENENYAYYNGTSEKDVFENYLIETDFYYDIPESKHHFIDVEKVRNDYYFIDIYKTDVLEKYLFIFN